MQRNPNSHKGENGKVAIIGGSATMHGAPLFSALAAEASGVDLVYVCLPHCHQEVARNTSLNFQVHPFGGNTLTAEDVEPILELLATMDSVVIGPGIAREETAHSAVNDIIAAAACALVIDATALHASTLELVRGKHAVLTPHLGELERMGIAIDALSSTAKSHAATIVFKGPEDAVIHEDGTRDTVTGGNAGLTVGGTGDVLAGLIAGLIAQDLAHDRASTMACSILKDCATELYPKYGYAFTARQVIDQIPALVHAHE